MVVLAGYLRPDFSDYHQATASIGFILLLGEYTILNQFVETPFPKHAIGILGVLLLLHGLNGMRVDKNIRRERERRLTESIEDYERTANQSGEFADIARGDDEIPESEYPDSEEVEMEERET